MLNRPPTDRRRLAAATARQRRYRRRLRDGVMPIQIDITADTVDMLVVLRWLAERDVGDKTAIARAVEAMLADAAADAASR